MKHLQDLQLENQMPNLKMIFLSSSKDDMVFHTVKLVKEKESTHSYNNVPLWGTDTSIW